MVWHDTDGFCHNTPLWLMKERYNRKKKKEEKEREIRGGIERRIERIERNAKKRHMRGICFMRWTHMSSQPEDSGCTLHTSEKTKNKYMEHTYKENKARYRMNNNQVPSTYLRNTGEYDAYATPSLYKIISNHKGSFRAHEGEMKALIRSKKLVVVPDSGELYEKAVGLNF